MTSLWHLVFGHRIAVALTSKSSRLIKLTHAESCMHLSQQVPARLVFACSIIGKCLTSYIHALCWLPIQHTLMFVNSEVGQHDHRDCEANFGNGRSGIHGFAANVQLDSVVT